MKDTQKKVNVISPKRSTFQAKTKKHYNDNIKNEKKKK